MAIVYLCGHGEWKTKGEGTVFTCVPAGTSLSVYSPVGRFLGVSDALAIMQHAQGAMQADHVFKAYESCPDTSLFPAPEFAGQFQQAGNIGGGQVHMVMQETKLRTLLNLYAGNELYWVACRGHNLRQEKAVQELFPRVAWHPK